MNNSAAYIDDLTHFQESIRTAELISAVISAILTALNVCLLLTCVSTRCRAISAAWYAYSLLVAIIFYVMILCIGLTSPTFYSSSGCIILHTLLRLLQLLYASFVVWINIEVFRTIICPKLPWTKSKHIRFSWQTFTTIGFSLMLVILVRVLTHHEGCWDGSYLAAFVIHLFKNWIPGLAVIILGILNIVGYVRLRSRGLETYNQFAEDLTVTIHPTEWFICVTLINIIFFFFEVLVIHLSAALHQGFEVNVLASVLAIHLLERLALLTLGLPILSLSSVRLTIKMFICKRLCLQAEVPDDAREDMNLDTIGNESL